MERSYIDIYCERMGPEYWAEPVNALTNLAFIISGLLVIKLISIGRGEAAFDIVPWFFATLICVIGIGSWLFHTHAQRWSMLLGCASIPVTLFVDSCGVMVGFDYSRRS